jgi:hypothetical protein
LKPKLGGIYAGSLTITDDRGQYWWYTMELASKGRRNYRDYEVSSMIRKEAYIDIPIENKFDEKIEFSVAIRGRDVYGPSRLKLLPRGKDTYRLTYLPLQISVKDEVTVSFTNSKAGEICCRVKTSSFDKKVEKLPIFTAEIGKFSNKEIQLTNPSNRTATVTTVVTNPEIFEVVPAKFEIPPYSTYTPLISYIPNEIEVQKSSDIIFKSNNIGDWKYLAFGEGQNPTDYEEQKLVALLKKEGSTVVTFTNPFKNTIVVDISLNYEKNQSMADMEDEESLVEESPFTLLFNKSRVSLQGRKSLSIPISFFPREINEYRCKLIIKLSEKISWVYPIRMVTEAMMGSKELSLQTICRKKKEKSFVVELPGLRAIEDEDEFKVELIELVRHPKRLEVMKKWFNILEDQTEADSLLKTLKFVTKFRPQKPFREVGILKVSRKRGGIWR